MILAPDLLFNRHRLSKFQIERHFGTAEAVEANALSLAEDHFQTSEAFVRLIALFSAYGIRFIPLKGAVLGDLIYGDSSARRFYDLDFLISPGEIQRAIAAAATLGYEPYEAYNTIPSDAAGWAALFAKDNHFICRHRTDKTDLELHWRFFRHSDFPKIAFDALYANETVEYCLSDHRFRKLSSEVEFAYILAHGAMHGWYRLKWLVDVSDYLAAVPMDLGKVERILHQNGMMRMAALYNAMATRFLPQPAILPFVRRRPPRLLEQLALSFAMEPARAYYGERTLREKLAGMLREVLLNFLLTPSRSTARRLMLAIPQAAGAKALRIATAKLSRHRPAK